MGRRIVAKQLTARDMDILLWVGRAGIANLEQVARRFWAGRREKTAMCRLRQLAKGGYLEKSTCDLRTPGELVFALTEKGAIQFSRAQQERLQVGLPAPAEIRQQLLAQDACLKVEAQVQAAGGNLVDWRPERELRAEFRRAQHVAQRRGDSFSQMEIPDAQAVIVTAEGKVEILHVEIDGAYYGKMLWQKARCLGTAGHTVVWVCTQARADYVQRAVAQYANIQVLTI